MKMCVVVPSVNRTLVPNYNMACLLDPALWPPLMYLMILGFIHTNHCILELVIDRM